MTNFLAYYYKNKDVNKYESIKYILGGIGAAILVPLLLNMLSSNLIKESKNFDQVNYFVFAGFCFVAGYFSDRFINTMGERILKDLEKTNEKVEEAISSVKENEEKINFIVSTESEPEQLIPEDNYNLEIHKTEVPDISTQDMKIVQAFLGTMKFRTSQGISKQIDIPRIAVIHSLENLENLDIVKRFINRENKTTLWALTNIGQQILNSSEVK